MQNPSELDMPTKGPFENIIEHNDILIHSKPLQFPDDDEDEEEVEEESEEEKSKIPRECLICLSEYPTCDFVTVGCEHLYCHECLIGYLASLINNGMVQQIHCPFPNCLVSPTQSRLRKLLSPEMYSKYLEFLAMIELRLNPNARWCPIKTCSAAIVCDPEEITKSSLVVCHKCHHRFCFGCRGEFHGQTACPKPEEQNVLDEDQFQQYLDNMKNKVKPCPRCSAQILKNSGCNQMTCVSCHYRFCWLCLQTCIDGRSHFSAGTCKGFWFSAADTLDEAKHLEELRRQRRKNRTAWQKTKDAGKSALTIAVAVPIGIVAGVLVAGAAVVFLAFAIPTVMLRALVPGRHKRRKPQPRGKAHDNS